ncbi:MAG: AtpZ/AtpI family protein, partial [Spirochaeta sp.]
KNYSVWSELGTFGVVGWAVAVPVLVFTAIGVWLDERYQSDVSWTLTLIFAGIVLGCVNAWIWVTRERKSLGDSDRNSQDVSNEEKE